MRVAIVRLTSLGDVVHTLPVSAAIRRHLPDSRIIWIAEEHERILLSHNPTVDEVVVAPLRRWRQAVKARRLGEVAREVRSFARRLGSLAIDVTIDVQGWAHKTSPIVALTRAPKRIGFSRRYARQPLATLFTTDRVTPLPSALHVVDQNLALLEPLGIAGADAQFLFPEWPDAEARVDRWARENPHAADRPIVLLASTRGARKLWPKASYALLARRLAAAGDRPIVLAGAPSERALFDEIRSAAGVAGMTCYTPESVADLAVFLRRPVLVIGNDTGPLHLAAARRVPSIGLFGPTSGARNGPYGPTGRYIQSPSGRMADITVDAVFDLARTLLPSAGPRGSDAAHERTGACHA